MATDLVIRPYISFSGQCEEAFLWYAEIFNGEIQHLSKYGDMPENPETPLSIKQKNKVMHAQLGLGANGDLSGTDALWPVEKGQTISIHAHFPEENLAQKIFSALSEGGIVLSQLVSNPPPDDDGVSGAVQDKYGLSWIISAYKSS